MESEWLRKQSVKKGFEDFHKGLGDKQERFVFTLLWSTLTGKALPPGVEYKGIWNSETVSRAMAAMGWKRATPDSARPVVCEVRKKLDDFMRSPSGLGLEYRIELPQRRFELAIVPYQHSVVEAFWLAHLTNGQTMKIVLTEQHEYWFGAKPN